LDEARSALSPLPEGAQRWALQGHIELLAGNPAAALEPLQRYHAEQPDPPLANYLYAWALIGVDKPAAAIPLLTPLSEQDPAYKDSPRLLAQALEATGQHDAAVAVSQRVAERQNSHRVVELRDQAFELAERGKYEAALSTLREAEQLVPNDAAVLNDLGGVLTRKGDYANAEVAFLRAEAIAPNEAVIAANLAQLYTLMGDGSKAQEQRRRFEDLNQMRH
jgi:predicted Zn-dependent protease